ncbi:indole-3-glycerol phosphate synthase TrpC [Pelovirga terrestris]|uniref:Indole-3-glycerol phosphate synthase n=1 Tax=Pelovirga terrestris TaxID=2771352 RepID=A0A8J6UGI2_9BACT|nr:indole-3-glycerol phosphate synthase TrpC [Pelovirga terrestris]MBD1399793.1 indole-3-glycerol phosphate synthase TrpC [Pelovirga terrestris]
MILERILLTKQKEVAAAKAQRSLTDLAARIGDLEDIPRGFARALRTMVASGGTAIIAEVKKGSPSKGIIRADFDPVAIAAGYQDAGATCLSVLTDQQYFYGHLRYLGLIREQVSLPLLCKDFIIDPYQLYQARLAGADAVLLIAAALDDEQLLELAQQATALRLDTLLEVHDVVEMQRALKLPVDLIGINNRDLRTFSTDLGITESLAALVPEAQLAVAESGITSRADIERLQAAGARAFLIGETLMREADIAGKLRELLGSD